MHQKDKKDYLESRDLTKIPRENSQKSVVRDYSKTIEDLVNGDLNCAKGRNSSITLYYNSNDSVFEVRVRLDDGNILYEAFKAYVHIKWVNKFNKIEFDFYKHNNLWYPEEIEIQDRFYREGVFKEIIEIIEEKGLMTKLQNGSLIEVPSNVFWNDVDITRFEVLTGSYKKFREVKGYLKNRIPEFFSIVKDYFNGKYHVKASGRNPAELTGKEILNSFKLPE